MKKFIVILTFLLPISVFTQDDILVENLQSDVKILWQALNELHPGLYRHIDTLELEKHYEDLKVKFSTGKSQKEAFVELSYFISKIKCGHTYLNPFNQPNKIVKSVLDEKVLLPFSFKIIDQKLVVDQSLSDQINPFDVVKCINEIEIKSILDTLTYFIKADGNRYNKKIKDLEVSFNSKYNYFDYYFPLIYGFQDNVSIEIVGQAPKDVSLINVDSRNIKISPPKNYDNQWSYSFQNDYAYLRLGTFVTWRLTFDWKEYLDNFFEELKQKEILSLVIDVKGNEGGLSEVSEYLIKKLATKKGQTMPRRKYLAYKKVSDNLAPHLKTWSRWFTNTSLWTKKLDENYRTPRFTKPSKKIKKNKNAYKGQTYLMINESNSSATFILAENCKLNDYATLVGTETGGTKMGITGGQIFFLTLPNTKIEVDIPLIGSYPEKALPDEGIKPDKFVERKIDDYTSGKDNQLNYVIDLIKEEKN